MNYYFKLVQNTWALVNIFFLNIFFMVFSIISVTTDTILATTSNHPQKIGSHSTNKIIGPAEKSTVGKQNHRFFLRLANFCLFSLLWIYKNILTYSQVKKPSKSLLAVLARVIQCMLSSHLSAVICNVFKIGHYIRPFF